MNIYKNEHDLEVVKFENDRLWEYFKYHAKQRIETFKFFVIFSGLAITGAITLLSRFQFKALDNCCSNTRETMIETYAIAGIILGCMVVILSYIFKQLDARNRSHINAAKLKIMELESSTKLKGNVFISVDDATKISEQTGFNSCFNAIFIIFALGGLSIVIYSIIILKCYP